MAPKNAGLEQDMTLRDYFSGQVISIFKFDREDLALLESGHLPHHDHVAKFCYGLADAMLAQREKEVPHV